MEAAGYGPASSFIKSNEFINVETYPYEVKGFLAEYQDADTLKVLGQMEIPRLTQKPGSDGRQIVTLTEPLPLKSGMGKPRPFKASKARPVRAYVMQQVICGRKK